jgi:hypothetical protein
MDIQCPRHLRTDAKASFRLHAIFDFEERPVANDVCKEKQEKGMTPGVANAGFMRQPAVYLCAVALGLLPHYAWPVRLDSAVIRIPSKGELKWSRSWSCSIFQIA